MADRATLLGFYQDRPAANQVLRDLRRRGQHRSVAIHHAESGRVTVQGNLLWQFAAALVLGSLGLLIGAALELLLSVTLRMSAFVHSPLALPIVAGVCAAVGCFSVLFWNKGVASTLIARHIPLVLPGETLVIVQPLQRDMEAVLDVLRRAPGDPPMTFALQPDCFHGSRPCLEIAHLPPLTVADLRLAAGRQAGGLVAVSRRSVRGRSLPHLLHVSARALERVQEALSDEVRQGRTPSMSAEWLLDNAYILQGHVAEFRRSLPKRYCDELPVVGEGPQAGLPRVYAIACELVADTEGRLDSDRIHDFVESYQGVAPLTMGELWALPLMLRLVLVTYVQGLAYQVLRRERERDEADFLANRLLSAAHRDRNLLPALISEIARQHPLPSAHLGEQLVDYLGDEETSLPLIRRWLEASLGTPLAAAVQQEQVNEAAEQVGLSNAIGSLRLFTYLRWRDSFEHLCGVDAILRGDPAGVYAGMDFATRDSYRHAVEEVARGSGVSETDVASQAVALAEAAAGCTERHVGWYLIDHGRALLERATVCVPRTTVRVRRWVRRHCARAYLGGVAAIAACVLAALFVAVDRAGATAAGLLAIGALGLLPAAEFAVQSTNYLAMRLMPPHILPRMSFDEGVPDTCRTLVVIPVMLLTPESIREEIEHLRTRYLANPDANLRFGLLSDFSDAPHKEMPDDVELLDVAQDGIAGLDTQYGPGCFFLFHRQRQWSDSEGCWIGWERKRGKLEHLNRFLMGESVADGFLLLGDAERLRGVRFVITLDSDTQLPRDSARRLIETIAHPLNRPHVSSDGRKIDRGYAIIQPRVTTSLPSATATRFSRVFADTTGLDPYTQAVSDVYQDISGEGSYHGKGIYDLAAFHQILCARLPENRILSHDLLEGAHVRVGLASDIELLDLFPSDYVAYARRQHRWTRGDWQISDWALSQVPTADGGRGANPLSALCRWKVADNLRRSLLPASSIGLLLAGWMLTPAGAQVSLFVGAVLLLPSLAPIAGKLTIHPSGQSQAWPAVGTGFLRAAITVAMLPQQAASAIDAVVRVCYRRAVSHKLLLQWETAQDAYRRSKGRRRAFATRLAWITLCSAAAAMWVLRFAPGSIAAAAPYLALWLLSPAIAIWLNAPIRDRAERELSISDRTMLRNVARQTWRFFADFVGPGTNWLPPDNYQEDLRVEVAQRTSPTNIGLGLLSTLAAHDLGYIGVDTTVERTLAALQSVGKLDRFAGHLLNWYDTRTLAPLEPRYVSMVDSGNLLGDLWALDQGLDQLLCEPILGFQAMDGLTDTLAILQRTGGWTRTPGAAIGDALATLERLMSEPARGLDELVQRLHAATGPARVLVESVRSSTADDRSCLYWAEQLELQVAWWGATKDRYLAWADVLAAPPDGGLLALGPEAHEWRRQALAVVPSLRDLAEGNVPGLSSLVGLQRRSQTTSPPTMAHDWLDKLADLAGQAQQAAGETVTQALAAQAASRSLSDGIDMTFLYDGTRRLFFTGYNVSERRMDTGHYDLLASEARLGSFVAVARGEVSAEHWWALGRPYGSGCGPTTLLSWNGSMFEYLMPLLLTRSFGHSLIDRACRDAVSCQIAYARKRHIPWGISEAAFSALDANRTYQYRSFGVPGLGIKRGLEDDLVVAPYATALALGVDAPAAVANLLKLADLPNLGMLGDFGYYESLDYTRRRRPTGERGIVVRTYMAHHQGMVLAAIDNALNSGIMQERFHRDPRVRAAESLLYERIPVSPAITTMKSPDSPRPIPAAVIDVSSSGHIDTPSTPVPKTNVLSNGSYSVMVTNAGSGYSRWRDLDITRWRADTTLDAYGSFCYLKDLDTGALWSAGHLPVRAWADRYSVVFHADKTELRRRDPGIETFMQIVVSPEDDVEVRHITLTNRSLRRRRIELTSYVEIALAPHDADRAHPAFSKMFVQTECLQQQRALIAWRRPRSADESPSYALHVVATGAPQTGPMQYETDRAKFIGRGHTTAHPAALDGNLSGTAGAVLDPVFSLRHTVTIESGERVEVAFVTGAAASRGDAAALADKYLDLRAVQRAMTMAWTHAELEMRRLRIGPDDTQQFQRLASYILYPSALLRPPPERLAVSALGQSRLWPYGISGDLPIVVLTIADTEDMLVVRQALLAHAYWRARGLKVDLVVLNEEGATYDQSLQHALRRMVDLQSDPPDMDQSGGVYLRAVGTMTADDRALLLASARVVLVAARGPLARQLGALSPAPSLSPTLSKPPTTRDQPSPPLPFMELSHFNGIAGFTGDGKEYAIYLGPGTRTPMPWVNVIANPAFGTIVSEAGAGPTWYGNSQANRLTPWSNDPVCDPAGDAIYIRDEALRVIWTPTPQPIREEDAYRVRHGQGYTVFEHNSHAIEQEMTVLVPVNGDGGDPVRIQRLRLRNRSSVHRSLSVTFYCEWVLGADREVTQTQVTTDWDAPSEVLLARNPGHPDYPGRVAFVAASLPTRSFTADRTEFLGRNGSLSAPAALFRAHLSGRAGAGLDPCAALQVSVELEPDGEADVVFLLGQAANAYQAIDMARRYIAKGAADEALAATRRWWDERLETVQIETPDAGADVMVNRWLLYQTLSCRLWARSAFYQSGGAYGFRDQLQDAMALVYSAPELAREQIVRAAARQFAEGDVQHWWHPQSGAGVRTRISDDMLWLPFVTAHYVRVTGDRAILGEAIPFREGKVLSEHEHEAFYVPAVSHDALSLLDHCRRAVARGSTSGPHGLPLMGTGDWNDGLDRVGIQGTGESVWLAWFLINVLHDLAEMLDLDGGTHESGECRAHACRLAEAAEACAWDGAWYLRAFFDDGTPLGSARNPEAQIDSVAQSWSVLSGGADATRAAAAMKSVEERLVRADDKMVLLFTPPFDEMLQDPGYIKGYPPGIRENGGQYTHGSLWVPMALARLGEGDRAMAVLSMMNPVAHALVPEDVATYRVEPYVVAADIYVLAGRVGQGGWTWYTGSSAWMYRIWLEEVLGFKLRGEVLYIDPTIPSSWGEFAIRYRYGRSEYRIEVENPAHLCRGVSSIALDDEAIAGPAIPLCDDGIPHTVHIRMGPARRGQAV